MKPRAAFVAFIANVCLYTSASAQCPTGTPIPLTCGTPISTTANQLSGKWGTISRTAVSCGGNKFSYSDIYSATYQSGMSLMLDHWWSQYQNANVYMEILNPLQGCSSIACNQLQNMGVGNIAGTSFSQNPTGYNNSIASLTLGLDNLGLIDGQTVYIKIQTDKKTAGSTTDVSASGNGTYKLQCKIIPENSCSNNVSMVGGTTYLIDNQFASDNFSNLDSESGACGYSIENNLMFKWCTDEFNSGVEVIISNLVIHDPIGGSMQFAILQGNCGGPYTTIQCNTGITSSSTIAINSIKTTPNTCYWIMLDGTAGTWWTANLQLQDANPVILPVSLSSFSGKSINHEHALYWVTETEENNDYFTIEKSIDGELWQEVGKIKSHGDSRLPSSYSLKTMVINQNETVYYRLSQTDLDGKINYYRTIALNNSDSNKTLVRIINISGQAVDTNYNGIVIYQYDDGSFEKAYQAPE